MKREGGEEVVEKKKKRKPNPGFLLAVAAFQKLTKHILGKTNVIRKDAMKIAKKVNDAIKTKFPGLTPDENAKKAMDQFDKNMDLYKL